MLIKRMPRKRKIALEAPKRERHTHNLNPISLNFVSTTTFLCKSSICKYTFVNPCFTIVCQS